MTHPDSCDLLVVGGGINGAGIARDAAGRGLSVALCEQGDFAGGTSSASTKLIHGGLRYLEYREFRLVAEALSEREHLLRIAAHISRPMRFVLPHVKGLRPRWMIRLGLWLYDHIGGRISLPHSRAVALNALGTPSGLRPALVHAFEYSDAWVDDARLVILNLRSAQAHGARILARTRLASAERRGGGWHCVLENMLTGEKRVLKARAVVNATGPWVGRVDAFLNPRPKTAPGTLKLVRGSHIVTRRLFAGEHAYMLQNHDRRIVFMIPYEDDYTLIGTTDVEEPDIDKRAHVSPEEEQYLLDAANTYLAQPIAASDIVWRYAGVRPLYGEEVENPSAVSRDYTLLVNDEAGAPCVSVYGGKITTYRRLAESVMEALSPWFTTPRGAWTATETLPGSGFPREQRALELARLWQAHPRFDPRFLERLFARHGLHARAILGDARTPADLGHDWGGGLTQREVDYLVANEWAREPDDILWRRTKCGLHMSEAQRAAFAQAFTAALVDSPREAAYA